MNNTRLTIAVALQFSIADILSVCIIFVIYYLSRFIIKPCFVGGEMETDLKDRPGHEYFTLTWFIPVKKLNSIVHSVRYIYKDFNLKFEFRREDNLMVADAFTRLSMTKLDWCIYQSDIYIYIFVAVYLTSIFSPIKIYSLIHPIEKMKWLCWFGNDLSYSLTENQWFNLKTVSNNLAFFHHISDLASKSPVICSNRELLIII